jgi:N-methylhydantoinase B
LVANDPYHGGGHLPDYNVFAPVFHDGDLVLIASIQCHHADTGGGMPGGYNVDARDIWAEGVRFPAVKIYEKGVERRDVTYLMKVNNRTPTFAGDLRAQVGAAQLGVRRLQEVLARYGAATVRRAVEMMIALAARRFREEVARWPDGVYTADVYVDHDPQGNRDIHLHCTVTIKRDRLTIDFTGSDTRPEIQAYSSFGNTRGYVVAQLASMK